MNEELKTYLTSQDWLRRSKIFKERKHYICELCGNHILLEVVNLFANEDHSSWKNPEISRFAESVLIGSGDKDKLIHAHHKSYKHIGSESFSEIACLCKPCHTFFHENTTGLSWNKAWEKTVSKVSGLLEVIHNQPDGKKEFERLSPEYCQIILENHGLVEREKKTYRSDWDDEIDEQVDEYFSYMSDFYRLQEDFE